MGNAIRSSSSVKTPIRPEIVTLLRAPAHMLFFFACSLKSLISNASIFIPIKNSNFISLCDAKQMGSKLIHVFVGNPSGYKMGV
ncbi:hypothetical protein [African swine fever virus]|uniref:Uncharacterized protein n=1 Tax=African swine fever virus TaxID=10497 RepID=A0A3G1EV79_ASF|nr:hypothetical protein F8221_gp167 [African swine fever virus]AOO54472.1 hypothetical protein AFSV47Ss_0167 [African swine fever virus]QID21296.1 hypothetical protein AFSV47Ss_0167 [African swine fever virus]QIM06808.1 hypothetical protein [African swine fever virus]QIM07043.1 hypothetical protein [African swine fever virus]QIM07278.1 hypothetical protein [African swine fever virus]